MHKVLCLIPSTTKIKTNKLFVTVFLFLKILKFELGMVTHVYNHSIIGKYRRIRDSRSGTATQQVQG